MTENLNDLYAAIDRLNDEELDQVQAHINQRRMQPQTGDEGTQAKIAALQEAVKDFWGGMSQAEIDAIVEDMNSEYIEPLSDDELG